MISINNEFRLGNIGLANDRLASSGQNGLYPKGKKRIEFHTCLSDAGLGMLRILAAALERTHQPAPHNQPAHNRY